MCKAAEEIDKASEAISDVAYSFKRSEQQSSSLLRNAEDIDVMGETIAKLIGNLEEVQTAISLALEHARAAAESISQPA